MAELERALAAVGREVDFPPTPKLAGTVRAGLAAPGRSRPVSRRRLALAFALLAVALGAAFTVPPARTAILEFLGLRGVEIERVPMQPRAPSGADVGLGERVTLAEARRRAGFTVLVPHLGSPAEVYFSGRLPGGQVGFLAGRPAGGRLLLVEFRAPDGLEFVEKSAGPGTTIEQVSIDGGRGYWLAGAPHRFVYVDERGEIREETLRLAGNTLLWERGELTLRLEGARTKAEALAIAAGTR